VGERIRVAEERKGALANLRFVVGALFADGKGS
jgi:hypothetical protein